MDRYRHTVRNQAMIPVDPNAFWPLIVVFTAVAVGVAVWKVFSIIGYGR